MVVLGGGVVSYEQGTPVAVVCGGARNLCPVAGISVASDVQFITVSAGLFRMRD